MSFLNNDNAQYLSARITQKGRKAIAKGNFQINYFQVGDSEFDYSTAFSSFTGGTQPNEKVFSPFDKETGVKYPLKLNVNDDSTYGNPVQQSTTYTIKNEMGPAGFVSNYIPNNTTIECETFTITSGSINGNNTITIPPSVSGSYFASGSYITLGLGQLYGEIPTISSSFNSFIYKVTNKSGNILTLDRNLPILTTGVTSFTGTVISNKCELEYPIESEIASVCLPTSIDPSQQLNSWTLNTIWTQQPIGGTTSDETLSGYTSNVFASTKERLGYTSTGQTFVPFEGLSTSSISITGFSSENYGTSFVNSQDEVIELLPSEQRCVAIIHYSELGDVINDPERFFKYDDYISTSITNNVATDNDGEYVTDLEYFEVYIPFLLYHRSTSQNGPLFTMDSIDYYVKSTKNADSVLPFRYLLDENDIRVGKVFYNNKIIVFDDQELVAALDYRSNRKYTLPAPKVYATPSDTTGANSMLSTTGQTVWLTYMMTFTSNQTLNALPCNYFNKVRLGGTEDGCFPAIPSQVSFKFGNEFNFLETALHHIQSSFVVNKIYALVQKVDNITSLPSPNGWKYIDVTSQINGVFTKQNLLNTTFTINYSDYSGATTFNLETHMSSVNTDYLGTTSSTTQPQFGDEQPFPGSIKLVRATDIEQMNFLINLPSNAFVTSQNPTCSSCTPVITEVQLLDSNKEPLVVAKTPLPIKRLGTQVLSVKLDF